MTVSIMLRLAKDALVLGRLAGYVEVVETGRRAVVRDADELLVFLREADADSAVTEVPNGTADRVRPPPR